MSKIFETLTNKISGWRKEAKEIVAKSGEKVISEVTVSQAFGGMRDIRSLICDTSKVPRDKGLIIRGKPLKELIHHTPEEVFYLLLTGDLPDQESLEEFSSELKKRKDVPDYVWSVLNAMPADSHPMAMLNTAILVMQRESVFAKEYNKGLRKEDYWKPTLEDALNIVAKIPGIVAGIYRKRFNKGERINPVKEMNLTADYVHMMGMDHEKELYDLIRIYVISHSDHEGGNVSALTAQTINSALSDLYYSLSGGFDGLAGPLHGLANQESLKFILETIEKYGGTPNEEQIIELVKETLAAGRVIPGYGHAVLRVTDPRFEAMVDFGKKHFPDDPVFLTVTRLYDVVPKELKKVEKIKNPWPNVDAASGSLLHHFGIKEFDYYTVMFAGARCLGITAQAVVNRGMMNPLIRPKSVTTEWIKENYVG